MDLKVRRLFIFIDWFVRLLSYYFGQVYMILFIRPRPHCGFESTAFVHFHRLVNPIIVILFW